MRIDTTLNMTNLLVILGLVGSGLTGYMALNGRVDQALAQSAHAAEDHDTITSDAVRIDALTTAIISQSVTNTAVMRALAQISQDVAVIKATVAPHGVP